MAPERGGGYSSAADEQQCKRIEIDGDQTPSQGLTVASSALRPQAKWIHSDVTNSTSATEAATCRVNTRRSRAGGEYSPSSVANVSPRSFATDSGCVASDTTTRTAALMPKINTAK